MELLSEDMSMADRLRAFWMFLHEGHYKIKNKRGKIVPLTPNSMQERLFKEMLRQALLEIPIRIIILKARKEGASTFIQALWCFLCQYSPHWTARTIAHTDDSTSDIHAIAERVFRMYQGTPRPKTKGNPLKFTHDSDMSTRTAGGLHVSSGANTNAAHLSELAKWANTKMPVKDQLASILESVPETEQTIIVIESTASMIDQSGQFKVRWDTAGMSNSPWTAFFSPWFEDPEYCLDSAGPILDPSEVELELRGRGVTDGQLQWRRRKILGSFSGDEVYWNQEFPSTPEEAFQCADGKVFPMLSEARHDRRIEAVRLLASGHRFYRGIDWGAVDPFVCLWAAHLPGEPGFSIDRVACPNTWREMTSYAYDPNGRPYDRDNHTCDVVRYICSHYNLGGHLHIYMELYVPDSAKHGLSVLDHAARIKRMGAGFPCHGTVADRAQPGNIMLISQQGVYAEPNRVPERKSDRGEILDGIGRLHALMIASTPLSYPPPPQPWQVVCRDQVAASGLGRIGLTSSEDALALHDYDRGQAKDVDEIFGVY